jgi:hypothetical protein
MNYSGGSEVDPGSQLPSEGESGPRQRATSSGQHRRACSRNGKHSAYYHQVKSAAVTASHNSALGLWSGIDPNAALNEEIGEEQCDNVNQMQAGTIHPRTLHAELTTPHDSSGCVGGKSEWSFAPAAAPKFMASAAWAESRAAGADALGVPGYDGTGCGVGARSGGSEWTGAEGTGQGEVRSGWLLKKAESSWGWRRRWFVLHPGRLTYQARSSCSACRRGGRV